MSNDHQQPLVSIIMPAYNMARFIGDAIQSVLNQTYPHWELLVIDDKSTDQTVEIVSQFNDSRIRILSTPRLGNSCATRNVGIREAKGDLVAFLDADDRYVPDALETRLTYLSKTPACQAIYGFFRSMNELGQLMPPEVSPYYRLADDGAQMLVSDQYYHTWENILVGITPHQLQGLMIRKSLLEEMQGLDEQFALASDYLFFIRLFKTSFPAVHYIPNVVFHYRVYDTMMTANPAKTAQLVETLPKLLDRVFSKGNIPVNLPLYLESLTRILHYRHYVYMRLKFSAVKQSMQIAKAALFDPKVQLKHWIKYCLVLYCEFLFRRNQSCTASV